MKQFRNQILTLLFLTCVTGIPGLYSQTDTTAINSPGELRGGAKIYLVPSVLIVGGTGLSYADDKNLKKQLQNWIRKDHVDFQTGIDDYLQWGPTATLVVAGLSGLKGRNTFTDQGKFYLISILSTSLVTRGLKVAFNEERPNGGQYSFPSGHTSNAFAGATVLYLEYRNTKPLLAWSGYLFATGTGILRVYNNAHWVPDVLVGAGLGILIPRIIYEIPFIENWHPFQPKQAIEEFSIIPVVNEQQLGVALHVRF